MSRKADVENLVKQLYGLGAVRRELARHAWAELGGQGFVALAAIDRLDDARVSDVAAQLAVDLSVASRQVQALIASGYVERSQHPADRRASRLAITADGARVLEESHRRMVHVFSEMLDCWSHADVTQLADGLERLTTRFADAASTQRESVESRS